MGPLDADRVFLALQRVFTSALSLYVKHQTSRQVTRTAGVTTYADACPADVLMTRLANDLG